MLIIGGRVMDEAQRLREQAGRYRRMMRSVTDDKALQVLEVMARECEQKAGSCKAEPSASVSGPHADLR